MTAPRQQYVLDSRGRKTAVIIPVEQYERMLEDLHDLAVVAERRDEGRIDLDEMRNQLAADGFLPR